jgi:TMEM175 potassium channel family protein
MVAEDEAVESFEVRAIAVERLTFFADAVVAIAITLLALDLPVPAGATNAELLRSAGEYRDEYIAFLISFLVVGAHWGGHHRVFRYVTALGGHLNRLTMYWLLMLVITPFATRVLTGDGAFQARFIFYAAVQSIAALALLLMVRDVRRHHLVRDDTPPTVLPEATLRSAVLAAAFLVSMPVSFVSKAAAYACWIVVPLVFGVRRRLIRRRSAR